MKVNHILSESVLTENGDMMYQIVDIHTKEPVGKPSTNGRSLRRKAHRLDNEYGANRYVVKMFRNVDEWDRNDHRLRQQVDKEKQDRADHTRTRDEFRDKMKSREGQSLQSGDRVYSRQKDKMYVVKRVTPDGVLFKGANRPVKVNTKNSGKKTDLGHRVFLLV